MIIRIKDVPPYNGDHEVGEPFTAREVHIFKRIGGILPGDFEDAARRGDVDLVIALAVIALRRKGEQVNEDALWDSELGRIELVGEDDEADAVPPPTPLSLRSSGVQSDSSGIPGSGDGDSPPDSSLSATGTQA